MKTKFLILVIWFGLAVPSLAVSDNTVNPADGGQYPVPQLNEKVLFYVQRTHNRNTVIYELNYQFDGNIDKKEPLHPMWIRYEEGGGRKDLSFIQNRVYGLNVKQLDKDTWLMHFRSYNKRVIYLRRNEKNNTFRAMILINGKIANLTSLFIFSVTNTMGIPSSAKYIDISGTDPVTGAVVLERVIP
jgi:hypothetical protein